MSKIKKTLKTQKQTDNFLSKFNLEDILPQKYHILAVILVIFILFLAFLSPMYFGGKTFQSGDIIASESMKPYVLKDHEGFTLWNPLIFCGMPAYSIGIEKTWFNFIYMGFGLIRGAFNSFLSVDYATWSFYLILLAITSFFLMKYLTKNTLVSLFTAIATSFSTGIIVFLYIGHVTKLTSICMYPLLFLILLRFREKIRLIDFLLLIITLQLFVQGFHLQIIFYILFAFVIYYIYFLIRATVKKEIVLRKNLLKSIAVFIAAVVIALLISADNFTQIYEYTPYSTRGGKSIEEKESGQPEENKAEYYDYHTNWSFSPGEVLTFIIPSYYGFGNSKYQGPLTQEQEVDVNTYFGQMPFVDVAQYMGVLVFFLALFAIITCWKDPIVQFLTIISGLALLISFGRTFPVIFDLMFNYFPQFNKFRVPSMILVLVQLSMPILAGLGIMKIRSLKNETDQKAVSILKYSAYIFSAIFVLGLLANQGLSSWFASRVSDYVANTEGTRAQYANMMKALSEFMSNMFVGDFLFAFGILTAAFWAANFYLKNKISADILIGFVILLTIIDLWRIDTRGTKYIDNTDDKSLFNIPDYITAIKNQKDNEPFRIINLKQDGSLGSLNQNSNFNAHFLLEDFYGYSGVKPRAYQDIIDVVGPVNETLWRMLNVKYIILDKQKIPQGMKTIFNGEKSAVCINENALPRYYFVDKVETKPDFEVLNAIKSNSFDPKQVAYINSGSLNVDKPDSTASIKLKIYTDEKTVLDVNASGNNFMFIGTTFYSGLADYKLFKIPTGWSAYIDGQKTEIYQTNHGFMGIDIPKGKHNIEITFAPISFYISKYIALILSSTTILGLIICIFMNVVNKKKKGIDLT